MLNKNLHISFFNWILSSCGKECGSYITVTRPVLTLIANQQVGNESHVQLLTFFKKQRIIVWWFPSFLPSFFFCWSKTWRDQVFRQSLGERSRVRHDWATSLSLFTFMHWRRKRQPTPVFLPGESQGQRSLVGGRLWGHAESDTTEVT